VGAGLMALLVRPPELMVVLERVWNKLRRKKRQERSSS